MKYFVSTINFAPKMKEKISDVVPKMLNAGIKNIEISSFHPYEKDLDLKKYKADILLHNFSPADNSDLLINLCSPKHSGEVISFIKRRILLTKELGQDYYSFHAGFRTDKLGALGMQSNNLGKREAMDRMIQSMEEIIDFAEQHKVHIGVENHFCIKEMRNNLILYDLRDWDEFFTRLDSNYLHLHLDIGHLKVSSNENDFDPVEFLATLGHKVKAVHVNDNTGWKVDCHAPFYDLWFSETYWRLLNNLEYVILETKSMCDMEIINDMIDYLEK